MNRFQKSLAGLIFPLASAVIFGACAGGTPAAQLPAPEPSAPAPAVVQEAATESSTGEAMEPTLALDETAAPLIATPRTSSDKPVPELRGVTSWINSEPFTFEEQQGKVVLVDFWTYTCINCIRTLPYIKSWHEKYADQGLVIVGVHTPEFEFEKNRDNVINATKEFGLKYPIAQDNDFDTWNAFDNRYWPAKYLVDKDGYIRYSHFGEGSYQETENWIRDLLVEAGADLSAVPAESMPEPEHDTAAIISEPSMGLTRELYAGFDRNYNALLSRSAPPYVLHKEFYDSQNAEILYSDPGDYQNHFLYLQGLWRNTEESIVHARQTADYDDYVAILFYATSANAVMSPAEGSPYEVRVTMDDAPLATNDAGADVMFDDQGNSYVTIDQARVYNLVNLSEFGGHKLKLSSNSTEFALFAYTFGAYQGGEPGSTS